MPTSQQKRPPRPASRPSRARSFDETFHEDQAILVLDEDGDIQHISRTARRLLDLGSSTITGGSFFERVHPDHLNRVKWDLVQMTVRGKQRVTWLLRLKTGLGPWQWFKLDAVNGLGAQDRHGIVLWMHERGGHHRRWVRRVWPTR
jgi:PAS domain-containing protein